MRALRVGVCGTLPELRRLRTARLLAPASVNTRRRPCEADNARRYYAWDGPRCCSTRHTHSPSPGSGRQARRMARVLILSPRVRKFKISAD